MLMLLAVLCGAEAGPWVNGSGQLYTKAGYVRFSADEYVFPTGEVVEGSAYVGHNHHVYGEVGLTKGLQAVFNAPFIGSRNAINDVIYVNRAFGDMDVGLEGGTNFGRVPASLQLLAKVPLYDNGDLAQYGLVAGRFPAIGDGQLDVTALASVGSGVSLGKVQGWVAGDLGYRHRTEVWLGDSTQPDRELGDGVPFRAQLGWSPKVGDRDMGWVALDFGGIKNLAQDEVTKEWAQLSGSFGARIHGPWVIEGGYTEMLWARNSARGRSVAAGVSFILQ